MSQVKGTQVNRDWLLWGTLSVLIMYGMVIFFSASINVSINNIGSPFSLAIKQWVIIFFGILVMALVSKVPINLYRRYRLLIGIMGLVVLLLVLIPGIGIERNYSTRWIRLPGFTYQPSELAKLAFIIYVAGYIEAHLDNLRNKWYWLLILLGVPTLLYCFLLMLEPDFGSTVQFIFLGLSMTFIAGAHLLSFLALTALFGIVLAGLIIFEPYRIQRLLQFLDPWQDPFGSGYNLTQSLMAIGRGDFAGVGLGNSIHKLGYLPEAHTDFIVSILAEELGTVGLVVLIVLYAIVIWRLSLLAFCALKQQQLFSGMVATGIALWLFFQVFVNIAGASQLLPPKGLVLPFFSQGGSFIITYFLALGLISRIEVEVNQKQNGVV